MLEAEGISPLGIVGARVIGSCVLRCEQSGLRGGCSGSSGSRGGGSNSSMSDSSPDSLSPAFCIRECN